LVENPIIPITDPKFKNFSIVESSREKFETGHDGLKPVTAKCCTTAL